METNIKIIVFTIGTENFGIPVDKIKGIVSASEAVECQDASTNSMLHLHNEVIPILNMYEQLQLPPSGESPTHFIIVASHENLLAFSVDKLIGINDIPVEHLYAFPPIVSSQKSEYFRQVAKLPEYLIIIFDSQKLFDNFHLHLRQVP